MYPKISVIIPVYNSEKYIAECLDSVLSQSYPNIEVICVDNCGQDGSRAIVDSYARKDARIKVLAAGSNKGPGPARNIGMDAASGEYFLFLDDDDLLAEDGLQHLYDAMTSSGADIVTGAAKAFADEDREDLHQSVASLNPTFALAKDLAVQVTPRNFQSMLDTSLTVVWGKLFSTEYMRRKGIRFYDGMLYHEDKGFWLKCIGSLPLLASTSKLVSYYRIRPDSVMTTMTDERKKARKADIRTAVEDGVAHLYEMHNAHLARYLHMLTRSHRSYAPNLERTYLGGLLHLRWYKHEKYVGISFVELYREKVRRDGIKIYRLLGIVFHKKRIFS